MKLTIKPNLQREKWSLYWWESMATMTEALETFVLELGEDATVGDVFNAVNARHGWPAADAQMDKLRLKGFEDKWEKALYKGKELLPQCSLTESGISDGAEITTIKIWLHAEGWQIKENNEYDSDTDSDDGFGTATIA